LATESIAVLAESAMDVTLSVEAFPALSVFVSVLEEPLQAANEPIAKTNKSFFIFMCLIVNDFMLIHGLEKSNLVPDQKSGNIFLFICNILIISLLIKNCLTDKGNGLIKSAFDQLFFRLFHFQLGYDSLLSVLNKDW
jgi:hypothetical protein